MKLTTAELKEVADALDDAADDLDDRLTHQGRDYSVEDRRAMRTKRRRYRELSAKVGQEWLKRRATP